MAAMPPNREASPLTLSLFGPFEVRLHGLPLSRLRSRKGHQLLALLTLRAGREVERSWLAGTLWPDSSESQGLANLRMSLKDLRRALGEAASRLRSATPRTVALDLTGAEADAIAFEEALARGDPPSLEQAVSLYRGPLLEGWTEEWLFQERQRCEQAYVVALESLATHSLASGDPEKAERHLQLAAAVDPLRESAQRHLMQALAAGGNYAAAFLTYRELRLRLHRELNAEPDAETMALFRQLRAEARTRAQGAPLRQNARPTNSEEQPSPAAHGLPLMAHEASPMTQELEIAHVLYMDLVGYSRLPLAEEPRLLQELQELVRSTAEFRRAEASGELLSLPTGDGMALVFFRDPVVSVRCAMEIARSLGGHARLPLRMGLHTGLVYRVEDINAQANVAGAGINLAQRVMECGDAGHILLSRAVRELIAPVGDWPVHDLGECVVKHGERIHLFNLCTEELGNPALPQAVSRYRALAAGKRSRSLQETDGSKVVEDPVTVVILYKHNAQPDEALVQSLEARLQARGWQVFVDRHKEVSVHWVQGIEQRIRAADVVIPLLSAASVQSELFQLEVQLARDAGLEQHSKPRLLPVRVQDPGRLPDPLAPIVGPLHHAAWRGPQDDEQVVTQLLEAWHTVPTPRPALPPPGGALPLDSQFYVVRPTDHQFHTAIAERQSIVLVKGARQMGKTSLLARGLQKAREAGFRDVRTDLQMLDPADLESAEAFYKALAAWLAEQLDLDVSPHQAWNPNLGSSVNFARFLRREILRRMEAHLVWGLDEVDRLFGREFANQVFGLFRSWHNERALDPTGPWSGLTLAIAYATEAHLFITETDQSPFNVGTRLMLADFTFAQVSDLNGRYGAPLRDVAEVQRFYRLVGGHPYLVTRGLSEMVAQGLTLTTLEAEADRDGGLFGDHLRRMLVVLARNPSLREIVSGVLQGRPCPSEESFYQLWSAGIVAGESSQDVRPRCHLYQSYLKRHLP
jgi:DNA-binding SARP family transcriptional activator